MGDYTALEIGGMWEVETHATSHLLVGMCEGAPPQKKKKKKTGGKLRLLHDTSHFI